MECFDRDLSRHLVRSAYRDRWRIRRRLEELSIDVDFASNGHLEVEVRDGVDAVQLRSVVKQFQAPRAELVDWLETCWHVAS
ncbi:MAG: Asr1405/Asl0597 family protein [Cyanobacteria bacterium J06639_1]